MSHPPIDIDVSQGEVTFKMPILLVFAVLTFTIGGYLSLSLATMKVTYDNRNEIENHGDKLETKADAQAVTSLAQTLGEAIKVNQEFIKSNQSIASTVASDVTELRVQVSNYSQEVKSLGATLSEKIQDQKQTNQREWDRINRTLYPQNKTND